ncbi:hypothetical protein [Liquorilactobacillus sicerae]|uniref:hypothetical protein n=1 Tax=Liquorilactobacillus sicerae TaxID=1416943 RepID=UPI002480A029|nr:hypothetical protein [Liquorilactobacillus sicerae]
MVSTSSSSASDSGNVTSLLTSKTYAIEPSEYAGVDVDTAMPQVGTPQNLILI